MSVPTSTIWIRKNPENGNYFPPKGWKVRVIGYLNGVVYHAVIEYNGKKHSVDRVLELPEEEFLLAYEKVS